jgi:tetratricopeptide (TPR) repeat protein
LRRSLALAKAVDAVDPGKIALTRVIAFDHEFIGRRLEQQGKPQEALANYRSEVELSEKILVADPAAFANKNQLLRSYKALSLLLASMGQREEALQLVNKMVASAEKYAAAPGAAPTSLRMPASAYATKAMVEERLASFAAKASNMR